MVWTGIISGGLIGLFLTRNVWGALLGGIIGYMVESGARAARREPSRTASSASAEFFRTTFELMGHVAKSDGRVSEAEIDAARRLMQELRLGPREITIAIDCFRTGKTAGYDAERGIERLRAACALRYDLLRAFMDLQLRAALAGNGLSPPARAILTRAAEHLGITTLEFAHMEASVRARQGRGAGGPKQAPRGGSLAECYAELEVAPGISDQDLKKAYRRQMSRHHPDKLVANGLPESMTQMAKEKTQRIQEAYEGIRTARGIR
jgi:DnaJ like chaperone protein